MDPSVVFPSVTSEQWKAIKDKVLSEAGVVMAGDSGSASAKGITIGWDYVEQTQQLTVTLINRQWFDPSPETIEQKISDVVKGCQGA